MKPTYWLRVGRRSASNKMVVEQLENKTTYKLGTSKGQKAMRSMLSS
jgi:hypothetical protein